MMPRQQDMRNGDQQQIGNFEATTTTMTMPDDYLEQMLSSLTSWNEFTTHGKSDWDLKQPQHQAVQFDEELASAPILNQMNGNGMSSMPPNSGLEMSIQGLYNGFAESLQSQQFPPSQQGVAAAAPGEVNPGSAQGQGQGQPRQRVRARRGQATDPHSIAERLRRERIAERMKGLQELVPNANKTDKASMLDEIIDYVKFLQLQVKVLSMSRLGGAAAAAAAAAVTPLMATANCGDAIGSGLTSRDEEASLTMTEQQVAKLMEEDMGSAMQYLQGKGLCLMPISLATTISTATSHSIPHKRNHNNVNVNGMFLSNENGPTSPTASVLTVQSSAFAHDATSALG